MKLYMRQKVFSWGDKFSICDEAENVRYYVEGQVFTLGKKLRLYDPTGEERCFIHQKLWSFLPRFFISRRGEDVAEVVKKFTFFRQEYTVSGLNWTVSGDFWAHTYEITDGEKTVASVSKRWISWGDTYEIDIRDDADTEMALCVVLVIDAVLAQDNAAASAGAASNN